MPQQAHATFEGESGERHPPAVADLPHHVGAAGAGTVEEHLVELRGPGELGDRTDVDPGLVHGHEQVGEPLVTDRTGLGATDHEAPVGLVGEGGPHLLAGDHPLVPVQFGPGLDVGQVAPGVGLGVALAPQLGPGQDRGQEAGPLCGGAVLDEGRADQPLAQDTDPTRGACPDVLLVEDDLVGDGRPPAPVLDRPADAGPPVGGQHVLPLEAGLEPERLVARPAPPTQRGELADHVIGQPGPDLLAEGFVLRSISEVHGSGGSCDVVRLAGRARVPSRAAPARCGPDGLRPNLTRR